jgi:hypothetical protein
MIQAIFIDIDGTLLDRNRSISPVTQQSLQRIIKKNIPLSFITGRSYVTAKELLSFLPKDTPCAFQNGALICTLSTHQILQKIHFPKEWCHQILCHSKSFSVFPIIFGDFIHSEKIYIPHPYQGPFELFFSINQWRTASSFALWEKEPCLSQIALIGAENNLTAFVDFYQREYSQLYAVKSMEIQKTCFFELFSQPISKVEAGMFLAEHFHVSLQNVLYIGDSYNDINLLKIVGYPAAVGNAISQVLDIAKFKGPANTENGVAWILDHIIH